MQRPTSAREDPDGGATSIPRCLVSAEILLVPQRFVLATFGSQADPSATIARQKREEGEKNMATSRELARPPAAARDESGRGVWQKMRALRRQGIIPGTIEQEYGPDMFVQANEKRFDAVYKRMGSRAVLFIAVGDQSIPVTVERVERGATSSEILHVEFLQVAGRLGRQVPNSSSSCL